MILFQYSTIARVMRLLLGDVEMINVIKANQDKFYNEFKNKNIFYNDLHIINYRELLNMILGKDDSFPIEELEEMLVAYIKIIGIIENIEIIVFENSNLKFDNTKYIKYLYLDNLESIINIINDLGGVDKVYIVE